MKRARWLPILGVVALPGAAACAEIIGAEFGSYSHLDDGSVPFDAGESGGGTPGEGDGGRAAGGTFGAGGRVGLGGTGGRIVGAGGTLAGAGGTLVGMGGRAAAGGQPGCGGGTKFCGGVCTTPNPTIGCGLAGCSPCPSPPTGASSVCAGAACSLTCNAGFLPDPLGGCVPDPGAGGAGGGPASCPSGQKDCDLGCVVPNPGTGCGLTGCSACPPAPANAYPVCANEQCAFDCYVGYARNASGTACEPEGGGAGGSGNGGSGSCIPTQCPPCGMGPCCNLQGRCGCMYFVCV